MRKGIFARDSKFRDWLSKITMNVISRRTVVITLLDETGAPKMAWTLHNAWPTKITGTDLKSEGNEVAVELLELGLARSVGVLFFGNGTNRVDLGTHDRTRVESERECDQKRDSGERPP